MSVPAVIDDVSGMLPPRSALARRARADRTPCRPVWGDAFRLSEVFTNLIQNALEATPAGGTVDVRVERTATSGVRVLVRNTGRGIPPELQERIFQPVLHDEGARHGPGAAHRAPDRRGPPRARSSVESDGVSETTFVVELPTEPRPSMAAGGAVRVS